MGVAALRNHLSVLQFVLVSRSSSVGQKTVPALSCTFTAERSARVESSRVESNRDRNLFHYFFCLPAAPLAVRKHAFTRSNSAWQAPFSKLSSLCPFTTQSAYAAISSGQDRFISLKAAVMRLGWGVLEPELEVELVVLKEARPAVALDTAPDAGAPDAGEAARRGSAARVRREEFIVLCYAGMLSRIHQTILTSLFFELSEVLPRSQIVRRPDQHRALPTFCVFTCFWSQTCLFCVCSV